MNRVGVLSRTVLAFYRELSMTCQYKSARQPAPDFPYIKDTRNKPCRGRFTLYNVQKTMPKRKLPRQSSTKSRRNQGGRPRARKKPPQKQWLYGLHTVEAAVANPARQKFRLLSTGAADLSRGGNDDLPSEILTRRELEELLPPGAVHQGVALEALPAAEKRRSRGEHRLEVQNLRL